MSDQLPDDAITASGADLFPLDRLALHMAKEQIMRGENPPMNTTATLVAALERITAALPALTAAIKTMTSQLPDAPAAQVAYRAYRDSIEDAYGPGFDPGEWADLTCQSQDAWHAAISAVLPAPTGAITAQATAADDEEDGYEPFIAAEGWREETSIRYVPESRVAEATAQATTTERESIRQLAIERKAVYVVWHKDIKRYRQYPFADLLGGTADGAHTPGGAT